MRIERKKQARSNKQTNKATQHSTPKAVTFSRKYELPRCRYSTRQTQGITHARFTRIARVSQADCTRSALRLHACRTRIARVLHAFDMGAGNAFVLMARGRMTRAAIAFTLVHHVCERLQGAACYAMTTPQLQAARLAFHDHASTTDLFGFL